jgi:CheY-like chemotaxis protein
MIQAERRRAASHGGTVKVLLVEDNDAFRTTLRDTLRREGYSVVEESNGDRALTAVVTQTPDIVILDHHIPGLMGIDLLRAVRERQPDLPVVLMSASVDPTTVEQALAMGRTRYLGKPFRIQALVGEIRWLTATL